MVAARRRAPTRAVERELRADGHEVVVGIDEVGRGAWAGPLVVGAAVMPVARRVNGVRDSKLLSETAREAMFARLAAGCEAWALGVVSHAECDQLGMAEAQRVAAQRAIAGLAEQGCRPTAAVVDGTWNFVGPLIERVEMRVKADRTCLPVAAASVLAKVSRDRWMREMAIDFPWWNFERNKGYPCHVHRAALGAYGPSAIHRRTWVFMDNFVPWTGVPRLPPVGTQLALFGDE